MSLSSNQKGSGSILCNPRVEVSLGYWISYYPDASVGVWLCAWQSECSGIVERHYVSISPVTICIYGPMSPLVDSVFAWPGLMGFCFSVFCPIFLSLPPTHHNCFAWYYCRMVTLQCKATKIELKCTCTFSFHLLRCSHRLEQGAQNWHPSTGQGETGTINTQQDDQGSGGSWGTNQGYWDRGSETEHNSHETRDWQNKTGSHTLRLKQGHTTLTPAWG